MGCWVSPGVTHALQPADMRFLGYFAKTFWTSVESNGGPVATKLEGMNARSKR